MIATLAFAPLLLAATSTVAASGPEKALEPCWTAAVQDPGSALRLVETTLGGAEALASDPATASAVAELRLCRGYANEQLGHLDLAGAAYEEAVATGERLGDGKLRASALALRGELAYYRGAFDAALADLDRAYRLEVGLGRESRQRYVLNAIANVYADVRVGAYDRAIEYYRQLLAINEQRGATREQATGHFNLGSTYERKGDLAAALTEYERASALDRGRNDPDEAAYDERAVASALVKLGRAREALPRIDRVIARFAATGDEEALAQARLTRGIARRAAGDPGGALVDLDAAAARFRSGGNDRFLVRVEEERAEALASVGDFAAAYRARGAQTALERKLAEVTRDEHTARLRVQFDSEKKEAENRALARENELRGRALADAERIRSLQRTVIALAAVLFLVAAALAVRQVRRARRMQVLALTDELTRLPNRRAFFARAAQALDGARRGDGALALLALDIDHFKRINDSHGHEAGDRVLLRVAQAARGALRERDVVGRTGGEEFLALLPGTSLYAAAEIAERLRAAVAALDASDVAAGLRVTVSVGVAERGAGDSSIEALARRADEALYRAKSGGRDRVEIAG